MKWASDKRRKPGAGKTIFSKVLTGYIAVTLLIVLLTGLVSYLLVRQYLIESNLGELSVKAQTVAEMFARPGGKTRFLSIERLSEMERLSDARFIYVDTAMQARQVPTRTRTSQYEDNLDFEYFSVIGSLDQELLQSLLDGETAVDVRKMDFMQDQVVFAGAPIVDDEGAVTGAVLLYRPLREVSQVSYRILLFLLLGGAVAVGCAAVLAWVLSRRITRPLTALNETAGHIADGHYGERVQIREKDEIGQLGMTLNLLSGRLSDVIENLSDEKSKLEQVILSIGEGVLAIDRDDRVVHHNGAALELLGLRDWQMKSRAGQPLDHQTQLLQMLNESMQTGERRQVTWKNDAERMIQAVVSPVINPEKEIIGAVCLLRDVSEAERLEQLRRDYIANISHELRTPLTGIRGMVEPLLDGYMETEEEKRECYQVIYQETLRLEKLIGEMLDLSRLQSGKTAIELEPMEIEGLLEAAARRLRERAAEGQVALSVEAEAGLAVQGNENRIMQVLIILLDNALSFTPPGGRVTLFARGEGGMAALGVRDTGAGISPEDLPYIWERFYKADKSRMRTSGTGLGLSIARLAVELMGGEIGVETEVGKGSTFTFTLKKAEKEA